MQRIVSWDVIKFIAIFFVVWGHALNAFDLKHEHCYELHRFIYSFHMPLFMIVSGYFSASSFQMNVLAFLRKKGIQLLLPAFSWSLITSLFVMMLGSSMYGAFMEFVGNSWFLKTVFACFVAVFVAKRIFKSDILAFAVSCVVAFVVPRASFLQFNWLLPFFWGGYFLHYYHEEIKHWDSWLLLSSGCIVFVMASLKSVYGIPHLIFIDVESLMVNGFILFFSFVWAVAVSLIIILLVQKLCRREGTLVRKMAFVGRYTLAIYVIQTILLEKILIRVLQFHIETAWVYNFVLTPLISCAVIVLCVNIAQLIEENRYTSLLLLGKKISR